MSTRGKKYEEAKKRIDRNKRYDLEMGIQILKETAKAKFDESVEMAIRLGGRRAGEAAWHWAEGDDGRDEARGDQCRNTSADLCRNRINLPGG